MERCCIQYHRDVHAIVVHLPDNGIFDIELRDRILVCYSELPVDFRTRPYIPVKPWTRARLNRVFDITPSQN